MSIELMSAVWKNGPEKQTDRFVLLSLADQANDAGHCWPSYAKTAVRCCMNRRSVMRIIQRLEDEEWLRRETRFVTGGLHTSNGFWLNLTKLFDGDTGSPRGDRESPGMVTEGHQGGDTGSPKPSINPNTEPLDGGGIKEILATHGISWNRKTKQLAGRAYITAEWVQELVDDAAANGRGLGWVVEALFTPPAPKPATCALCGGRHESAACKFELVDGILRYR